jgi:hypothetical protein
MVHNEAPIEPKLYNEHYNSTNANHKQSVYEDVPRSCALRSTSELRVFIIDIRPNEVGIEPERQYNNKTHWHQDSRTA